MVSKCSELIVGTATMDTTIIILSAQCVARPSHWMHVLWTRLRQTYRKWKSNGIVLMSLVSVRNAKVNHENYGNKTLKNEKSLLKNR